METLPNDTLYVIMQNMDMDVLSYFCKSNKYINNLCNNEQFWKEYIHGDNFYLFMPNEYNQLHPLVNTNSSWKEIFNNVHTLNHALENDLDIQFIVDNLVMNNKLDTLRPYFFKIVNNKLYDAIIFSGLKYGNHQILDLFTIDNISLKDLATYLSPQSYDYLYKYLYNNIISALITYNNVPLIKHIIKNKKQITQQLVTTAMNSYNTQILDYFLSFSPNVDIKKGINYMYGKIISPLLEKSKDKNQVFLMVDYLMDHQLYGDDDNFIFYLIKTQNIDLLNQFNPPKISKFINYAKNYALSYDWFTS